VNRAGSWIVKTPVRSQPCDLVNVRAFPTKLDIRVPLDLIKKSRRMLVQPVPVQTSDTVVGAR
jgi:hypothetical protein